MHLKQEIAEHLKAAMRSGDIKRRDTIRLLQAAIKQREIDEQIELDDTQILAVLDKLVKQRRDSAQQFRDADRLDLAEKEEMEMEMLQAYLPAALTQEEITQLIDDAISATDAQSMKEMGKVMGIVKSKVQGRADMSEVSALIKQKLS